MTPFGDVNCSLVLIEVYYKFYIYLKLHFYFATKSITVIGRLLKGTEMMIRKMVVTFKNEKKCLLLLY